MSTNKCLKTVLLINFLLLLSLSCNLLFPTQTSEPLATTPAQSPGPQPTPTPGTPAPTPPPGVYPVEFAAYLPIQVNLPVTFGGQSYTLPVDLAAVRGVAPLQLSEQQLALLSQNGFVVLAPIPGEYREFYQIYETHRYDETNLFITTDSVFHIYHLIFDKMLRDLEREHFIATLEKLTSAMLAATYQQYETLRGTVLEEPARRNVAFFAVAAQLLNLPDTVPAEVSDLVNAELALINAAEGPQISPIWDREDLPGDKKLIEDYTQYIPRGHYTRSEELKKYFRTMMWYGRLTFRLRDDFETRRALLIVQALRTATANDGTPAVALWQNIYDPTVFIVGKADDLSYHEYGVLMDTIFGPNAAPQVLADEGLFAQFKEAARTLPPPQINSMWVWIWEDQTEATKGFRFMGQRFTLDAYVFGQLIWRKVGTPDDQRGLPKGLDFFAAMGSEEAYTILQEMDETHYANYETQMAKVQSEVAALGLDSWTQNLYWSWLYAFQPIIAPKGVEYPPFMQNQAWARKDLNTALGSWTELKHDTILYAKQVMAEMGGGELEKPPHGYVEPNPEAYARLRALAQMTLTGLQQRGLLTDLTRANLENLIAELQFLQAIAEKELAGILLTDEEYMHILYWGGILEQFTLAAADTTDYFDRDLSDQKAALIADVATGLDKNIPGLAVLEEAIGQPTVIYVVLPDSPWRIGIGAVFSYYEFILPASERMTDEQWQAKVEIGDTPPLPEWTNLFIAP
ncbi:MAG: DUF3160 domain-containing protein [Chloroflexota bacterium]